MSPQSPLERTDGRDALASVTAHAIDDALADAALERAKGATSARTNAEAAIAPRALANGARVGSPGGGSGLIKDALRLVTKKAKDGATRTEIARVDEQLSFDKGFYLTIRAIQLLKASAPERTIVVGVAGAERGGQDGVHE